MKPFPILASIPAERDLTLLDSEDVDALYRTCQDPEITRWTTVGGSYSREDALDFVNSYVPEAWSCDSEYVWAIRGSDHRYLGTIGIKVRNETVGEVGFYLDRGARGRGIMTQALRTACRAGLGSEFPFTTLRWRAVVGNVGSARVAQRCGFRYLGIEPVEDGADHWVAELGSGQKSQASVLPWPIDERPPHLTGKAD